MRLPFKIVSNRRHPPQPDPATCPHEWDYQFIDEDSFWRVCRRCPTREYGMTKAYVDGYLASAGWDRH